MDKLLLRNEYRQIRLSISDADYAAGCSRIALLSQRLLDWNAVSRVHIYRSRNQVKEVDTSWLAAFMTNYPPIELTYGSPNATAPVPSEQYDVVFVPLLSFDVAGHRLGYGGGWYDRFLSFQTDAKKIGLAFDVQRSLVLLPTEPHDVPLDYIVTESGVLTTAI